MHIKKLILLFVIVALGFFARAYKLSSSPEALYIDETSIAYNAYSIISTGRDEHGKFMPLFFEAFGEYKLPVYIYAVALTQTVIGPSDLSVRLPAVFFGTFTIPLLFLFSKELLKSSVDRLETSLPYLCAFLLAISPWHFQFTRPGFEASAGLLCLIKLKSRNHFFILILFLIGFIPPALAMAMPWYQPHALRALMVLPASTFISAYGFGYLISKLKRNRVRQACFGIYILSLCFFTITFLDIYHNKYAIDTGRDWQADVKQVALAILPIDNNYDGVYFSPGPMGTALVWYLKYNPKLYQSTLDKRNLGKYHLEIASWETIPKTGRNLYITYSNVPAGKLFRQTYFSNGQPAYNIWII